jgi:hypothetical protein
MYSDLPLSGLTYTDPCSCYSDSEPETYFQGRSSSLLPPAPSTTTRLQDPHHECDRNLGWNIDWAVAFIVNRLDKKDDASEVLRNVRVRATLLEKDGLAKDILDHVFNKLDETLFAGHFKNAIYLECISLGPDVSRATCTQGWGPLPELKQISVVLNSDVLDGAWARDVVAILIHHMK